MKNRKEFSARPLMRKTKWRRAGFLSLSLALAIALMLITEQKQTHDAGCWGRRALHLSYIYRFEPTSTRCLHNIYISRPECLHYLWLRRVAFRDGAPCLPKAQYSVPGRKRRRAAHKERHYGSSRL